MSAHPTPPSVHPRPPHTPTTRPGHLTMTFLTVSPTVGVCGDKWHGVQGPATSPSGDTSPGLTWPPMIPRFDRLCYGVARDQPPPSPPPTRAQGMKEGGDVPGGVLQAVGGWLRGPQKGYKRCYDDKHTQARACGRGWWTPTETQAEHSPSPRRPLHMHTYTGRLTACLPSSLAFSLSSLAVAEPTRAKGFPSFAALTTRPPRASQARNKQTSLKIDPLYQAQARYVVVCVSVCFYLAGWVPGSASGGGACLPRPFLPSFPALFHPPGCPSSPPRTHKTSTMSF